MTRVSNQQLFLAIWAIAMVLSIKIAQNTGRPFSQSGKAIAYLARSKGTVQYRPSDTYLWVDTAKRQSFQDGSVVATGPDSAAEIALPGGQSLSLSANSQVVIEHHDAKSEESAYVITVVKGEVKEKARAKPKLFTAEPLPLAIRADDSFKLAVVEDLPVPVISEEIAINSLPYSDPGDLAPTLAPDFAVRHVPPYSLRLAAKGDSNRLTVLMGGADLFHVETNQRVFASHGRFFVKDGKIIGELRTWKEPVPWTAIADALGLDLAFEGRRAAWLGTSVAEGKGKELPEQLFVAAEEGGLIAVNRALLSRHPDASALLARGKGLFSEQVLLLGQSPAGATPLSPKDFVATPAPELKVVFLDEVPDDDLPRLKAIDESAFNALGWLASAHFDQSQLDVLLNRQFYRQSLQNMPTEDARISLILKICAANIAVFAPPVGDWAIFVRRGGEVQRIEAGDRPSGKLNERRLHEWIMGRLGFDGVVAERTADYLRVVGSVPSSAKHPRQGLVLRDSADEALIFDVVAAKPSELVEFVGSTEGGSIYKVLIPSSIGEEVPVGSKILLE